MIVKLDLTSSIIAQQVLDVQIPAYRVEAELIGFDDIPQLSETIEDIMSVDEVFYGYFEQGQLAGVVSLSLEAEGLCMNRLVVSPLFFRQGIATKLVQFVLEGNQDCPAIRVSTGAKNTPAIRFYQQMGFIDKSMKEVAPDVFLINFEFMSEDVHIASSN